MASYGKASPTKVAYNQIRKPVVAQYETPPASNPFPDQVQQLQQVLAPAVTPAVTPVQTSPAQIAAPLQVPPAAVIPTTITQPAATAVPPIDSTTPNTYGVVDNSASIEGYYGGLSAKQIGDINFAINTQNTALARQKPLIEEGATNQSTGVYGNARISAIGNNENLANRGLAGGLYQNNISGVSESSRIAQNTAMRNSLNGIQLQKVKDLANIDMKTADNEAARGNQIAGVNATTASESALAKINEMNRVQGEIYNRGQTADQAKIAAALVAYNQGRDTLGDTRYTNETAYNQGRDTKNDTIAAALVTANNNQSNIDNKNYSDQVIYNQGRDALNDTINANAVTYNQGRDAIGDTRYTNNLTLEKDIRYNENSKGQTAERVRVSEKKTADKLDADQLIWEKDQVAKQDKITAEALVYARNHPTKSGGSGGSSSSKTKPLTQTQKINSAYSTYSTYGPEDLTSHKAEIIKEVGPGNYDKLVKDSQITTSNGITKYINQMNGGSVPEVKKGLTDNSKSLIKELGQQGYNDLWNNLLAGAILAGTAKKK